MGVPKFYRWMSERYPCLSEVVKEHQLPEFDNLYLDMNGIVHICSHPEDDNPHFRITEEKIFEDIFHYIEVLFRMIKPQKVFFMAIDGVAPRAKMNQQRGRRFRSAKEADDLIRKALQKGEVLPTSERFDSNCITPGTPFMVRLQEQLKYFVVKKVSTDPLWQGPRIFLSGHQTPGEGEHKIMDFIRYEKSQPNYDPNTRHCLYGLDADLIMLGLTSHEPHFSLLREEVRFGGKESKNKRSTCPEETTFHLLHLSLFREYLDFEFGRLKNKLPFEYNIENIVDDWVLMGFIVGNDFIPHAPDMHIKNDALPMIWQTYASVLPTLDGYLNEGGSLNLRRFEKFLTVLSDFDVDQFNERYADLKWFAGKTGNKKGAKGKKGKTKSFAANKGRFAALDIREEYSGIQDEDVLYDDDDEDFVVDKIVTVEEEKDAKEMFQMEFRQHKRNYYMEKLEYPEVTPEVLQEQAHCYVLGIQWILNYYYNGVVSWGWYYPHHYAPFLSDVRNFSQMSFEFEYGKPFLPFQQLMAVLPAASKNLLPECYQTLMTDEISPVIDFYPEAFDQDLNGKQQAWEAVVLIPFIDENRLLEAMASVEHRLTPAERTRNTNGSCIMYRFTEQSLGTYKSANPAFPDILFNHAKESEIGAELYRLKPKEIKKGLCEGVRMDVYYPGFPTMKHIKHSAYLEKCNVKVFQMNSRSENMMLKIEDGNKDMDIDEAARELVGRSMFVSWPHLIEAKVVAISDGTIRYDIVECSSKGGKTRGRTKCVEMNKTCLSQEESKLWYSEVGRIRDTYYERKGIVIGQTNIVVYARPMMGRKYVSSSQGSVTLEKQWSTYALPFVFQTSVKDIASHDPSFAQFKTIDELFPLNSDVFMLGYPHYGCMGKVLEHDTSNSGRLRIELTVKMEPNMMDVISKQQKLSLSYMPGYVVAKRLGISGHLLSRITGTVFIAKGSKDEPRDGKINIGLNLKFNKRNEEVPGYTKKTDDGWQYSNKALQEIGLYMERFPELWDYLVSNTTEGDVYYETDVYPDDTSERIGALAKFLKELPCQSASRMKIGSDILDEPVIELVEKEVDKVSIENKKRKRCVKVQVRPHLLYKPITHQLNLIPDTTAHYLLFDRVINCRLGYSTPLGLRGTVTGIYLGEKELDTIYDVVFDEPFQGGIALRCKAGCGYKLPPTALINLSHGDRKEEARKRGVPIDVIVSEWSTQITNKPHSSCRSNNDQQSPHSSWRSNSDQQSQNNGRNYSYNYNQQQRQQQSGANSMRSAKNSPRSDNGKKYNAPDGFQARSGGDEFANMWKELKSGGNGATGGNPQPEQPRVLDSRPKMQEKLSIIKQPAEKPLENSDKPQSSSNIDDFMAMFQSLSLVENKQQQPKQEEYPQSTNKSYGRKVTVEELFKTAAESTPQLQTPSDFSAPPPSHAHQVPVSGQKNTQDHLQQQRQKQKIGQPPQPQQQQPHFQHYHPSGHSAQQDLHNWSLSVRLQLPKYELYQDMKGPGFVAYVTLGNGLKFKGSFTHTDVQATESAAAMAMLHITNNQQPWMNRNIPPVFGPPGAFGSTNSAFRPVHPFMGAPPNMVPEGQYHYSQNRQNSGRTRSNSHRESESSESTSPRKPSTSNPFIPLQVTKNQKTPQKRKDSETEASAAPVVHEQPHHLQAKTDTTTTPRKTSAETPRKSEGAKSQIEAKSTESSPADAAKSGKSPRKPRKKTRSRLAANFGDGTS
ncbi:5'-3' exoribonuclease 1-like isoform X2 [Tubulanus polymorphus]|uniref:5'-3' exoribonuclease 1-like isoform X2 n=1 Tax=Tubulanus polymorphus TaxID=672921 RepID=UPI003DA64763